MLLEPQNCKIAAKHSATRTGSRRWNMFTRECSIIGDNRQTLLYGWFGHEWRRANDIDAPLIICSSASPITWQPNTMQLVVSLSVMRDCNHAKMIHSVPLTPWTRWANIISETHTASERGRVNMGITHSVTREIVEFKQLCWMEIHLPVCQTKRHHLFDGSANALSFHILLKS